jgi:tripartite-type tricarboxylate transporter receptor subunit TctC
MIPQFMEKQDMIAGPQFRSALMATVIVSILAGLSAQRTQAAEDPAKYPSQPIRMIVPFAPGGASDFTARNLQPGMTQALGQQIVVENRPGAAGNIGMDVAARAAPDGYTIFLGNVGTMSINKPLYKDLTVDPAKAFVGVSLVAETPGLMVAYPKFAPNNVQELVAYAKANPGQVNYASPGSGSLNGLEMELFRRNAGLDMTHVPYKGGAGPATQDTVGGHVHMTLVTISSAIQQVKGGRLKALAVTTRERAPTLPNVPTMIEQGFPNSVSASWQGVLVPTGTPRVIIDKLLVAIGKAMEDPKVRARLSDAGIFPVVSKSPEEFKEYLDRDSAKWTRVIDEIGATPD